jgi:GT2 family glycosyltransferase
VSEAEMQKPVSIDAVICSINPPKFQAVERNLHTFLDEVGFNRAIMVENAPSMTIGYNRGARQSSADWIVFCHDDIELLDVNLATVRTALESLDIFGLAGTDLLRGANWYDSDSNRLFGSVFAPRPDTNTFEQQIFGRGPAIVRNIQALDGIFIACRRDMWANVLFDEEIEGFTLYDIDFCYRAYLSGARLGLLTDFVVYHDSHVGNFSAEKIRSWERNQERVRHKLGLRKSDEGYVKHETVLYDRLPRRP